MGNQQECRLLGRRSSLSGEPLSSTLPPPLRLPCGSSRFPGPGTAAHAWGPHPAPASGLGIRIEAGRIYCVIPDHYDLFLTPVMPAESVLPDPSRSSSIPEDPPGIRIAPGRSVLIPAGHGESDGLGAEADEQFKLRSGSAPGARGTLGAGSKAQHPGGRPIGSLP